MKQANKMMDEANAILEEAQKSFKEGLKLTDQIFAKNVNQLEDREKMMPLAKEASEFFDKAAIKSRDASKKVDAASQIAGVPSWYKDYLLTVAQLYNKQAEEADICKEIATSYVVIKDINALSTKYNALKEQEDKLDQEKRVLADKIAKMEADNKGRIR